MTREQIEAINNGTAMVVEVSKDIENTLGQVFSAAIVAFENLRGDGGIPLPNKKYTLVLIETEAVWYLDTFVYKVFVQEKL